MSSMLCILSETIYSVGKYDKKIYYCSRDAGDELTKVSFCEERPVALKTPDP